MYLGACFTRNLLIASICSNLQNFLIFHTVGRTDCGKLKKNPNLRVLFGSVSLIIVNNLAKFIHHETVLYGTELRELTTLLIDDNFHWVCFQFSNGEMLSFLTYMLYVIFLFLWVPLNDTTKVMLSLVLHEQELLNNSQLPERCLVFLFKFIFASL